MGTFNDDKCETELQITVEFARPATLYLLLDKKPAPAWATRAGFTDTGAKIGFDEGPSGTRVLATTSGPGGSIDRVFSGWKLASRLSYFLWSSMPDDELLAAAATGQLAAESELLRQTRRMLADPRAVALAQNFATQWLAIRNGENFQPEKKRFFRNRALVPPAFKSSP